MNTASESATAAVNAISASDQNVLERNVCVEGYSLDQLDEKKFVLYVIDGLPDHHNRITTYGLFWKSVLTFHIKLLKSENSFRERVFLFACITTLRAEET